MSEQIDIKQPTYIDGNYRIATNLFDGESRLVYGTSGIGGVWGKVDEQESIDSILYALEHGVTALDTSPSYNNAQKYVGQALNEWNGKRPFISTKVGRLKARRADEVHVDYSPESMRRSLSESLELLGVDYIDLLFLHEPQLVPEKNIDTILETLITFQEEGTVGMLGIGGNPDNSFWPYVKKEYFDVVSTFLKLDACSLEAFEHDIPEFEKEGIAVYAASSLHMGLLGSRYEELVQDASNTEWIREQDVQQAIKVNKIADKYGLPLSNIALRYLFSMQEADRVVMGATDLQETKESLAAWEEGKLPKSVFDGITTAITH